MITTLVGATVAFAGPYDAKAIFYSDSVLRNAIENIAQKVRRNEPLQANLVGTLCSYKNAIDYLASLTMKHSGCSSSTQGGGKRCSGMLNAPVAGR
jgi:hypothetical protein